MQILNKLTRNKIITITTETYSDVECRWGIDAESIITQTLNNQI